MKFVINKDDARVTRLALYTFLGLAFLYRLYYAGSINLVPDEAYYWTWSRNLSLGYYDSGAILAWVIRFFTDFMGNSELGVRMASIIFFISTNILLYFLSSKFVKPIFALLSIVILNLTPGGVLLGILMMHDSLMAFFWVLTILSLYKAILENKKGFWYLAGIAAGFGLWSKDTMVLVIPATFLFLVFSKEYRFWLKRKEPYFCVILMFLVFSPIIYWNSVHDWVTYRHIFALGSRPEGMDKFKRMGDFVGSQLGLISPFIWLGILFAWINIFILWIKDRGSKKAFLLSYSAFIFLFFLWLSSRSKVEGNWSGFAYYVGIICYFYVFQYFWEKKRKKGFVLYTKFAVIFSGILVCLVLYPKLLYKLVYAIPYSSEKIIEGVRDNRTNDAHGWTQFGKEIRNFKNKFFGDQDVFIFGVRYQVSSQIAFYYPNIRTYCLPISRRMNQYDIWGGLEELKGKDGIFILDKWSDPSAPEKLKKYFDSVIWMRDFTVYRNDMPTEDIRNYSIYVCRDFQGMKKDGFEKF
ncbi:ArnT family glycosyltransferase [bacterium]